MGFELYQGSIQRYEDEKWQHGTNYAASVADSARSRFQEAATSLRDNADRVPSRLESEYTEISCYAESMVEAAQLRREAAFAAEAGDRGTAAEQIDAAQRARDRCPPA